MAEHLHWTRLICLLALYFHFGECSDWFPERNESHPCQRECVSGQAMTCQYTFRVEWYLSLSKACYDCPNTLSDCYRPDCVTADGVTRMITVVNRQLPGPKIEVCLGDKIIVDLENLMEDESTAIHWHGHHQVKTPFMDGVPFITQCPIIPNSVFRYTMWATNAGTHFWHSHTGIQRTDGIFGALVVRIPDEDNSFASLYDEDLSEHIIVVNDWTRITGTEKLELHLHGGGDNLPDSILVNGRGRYYNDTVQLTDTPLAVFTVQKGLRYRFRVINSGLHSCPIELTIDNHNITAIASDGFDFEPVEVDSLVSYAGERWDFILTADQDVDNYWIRFTGLLQCATNTVHQVAVLHYEGASEVEPTAAVGYALQEVPKLTLNALNVGRDEAGTIIVPDLSAVDTSDDEDLLKDNPDVQIYLAYDFNAVNHTVYHKEGLYGYYQVAAAYRLTTPQFNNITFKTPTSPLLTQFTDNDPNMFCENRNLSNCGNEFCECTNKYTVAIDSLVELILIDIGVTANANHPFHLHGYAYRVVAMDKLGTSTSVEAVKELDSAGGIVRNLQDPPYKDTVTVPDGGYTVLRFKATNPGFWLFHCHIEFHVEAGLAVVFQVGETSELPPPPKGFPICGHFKETLELSESESSTSKPFNADNALKFSDVWSLKTNISNALSLFWPF